MPVDRHRAERVRAEVDGRRDIGTNRRGITAALSSGIPLLLIGARLQSVLQIAADPCAPQKSCCDALKAVLVMETSEN